MQASISTETTMLRPSFSLPTVPILGYVVTTYLFYANSLFHMLLPLFGSRSLVYYKSYLCRNKHIRRIYTGISLFRYNSLTSWRSACSNLTFLLPKTDTHTVGQLLSEMIIYNEIKTYTITINIFQYNFI